MALKGPHWFLARCLEEERKRSRLTYLAARALDLGLRRTESTSGHVFQACGAVQQFLAKRGAIRSTIQATAPHRPYRLSRAERVLWLAFITPKAGNFGRTSFGYDYGVLKGYLTARYGGHRTGGGGGDNELEICFRLLAEFLD